LLKTSDRRTDKGQATAIDLSLYSTNDIFLLSRTLLLLLLLLLLNMAHVSMLSITVIFSRSSLLGTRVSRCMPFILSF
jgi:hypothetical protein